MALKTKGKAAPKSAKKPEVKTKKRNFKSRTNYDHKYRKWDDWEEGDYVVGEVVGEHKDKYGKIAPVILVEEASFADDSGSEFEGNKLALNFTGGLNKKLEDEEVDTGDVIQVTYNGKNEITSGKWEGEKAHAIDLAVDRDGEEDYEEEYDDEDESL